MENVNWSLLDTNKDHLKCLGRARDGADQAEKEVRRLRAEREGMVCHISVLRRELDVAHESNGQLRVLDAETSNLRFEHDRLRVRLDSSEREIKSLLR